MEQKLIDVILQDIYRRFPEFVEIKPKVRRQPVPESENENVPLEKRNYLFTFQKNAKGPKGQVIPRWIRVVVSPKGKIVKTTTSK